MNDALARAIRTYLDAWIGTFLGLWVSSGIGADDQLPGVADLAVIGKLGLAAAIASIPALLSFVKNQLEDQGRIPVLLGTKGAQDTPTV